MPRGRAVLKITVEGAGPVAAQFSRAQRMLQDEIIREFRDLRDEAEAAVQERVPRDLNVLAENTQARVSFRAFAPAVTVYSGARSANGFSYLDVTRYGHRQHVLVPRRSRALKVYYAGRRNPHLYVYAKSVRGSRPRQDWVAAADRDIDRAVDATVTRLGRTIETRLFR